MCATDFQDLPFSDRVRIWFGSDPVGSIRGILARYANASLGLHLTDNHGALTEPDEPPVAVAISRTHAQVSWVRLCMVHDGNAYVEEFHVDGWSLSRVADEAAAWRRAVQAHERESQRITPPRVV